MFSYWWCFMIWWYEDNDTQVVLIYIVVTIMMPHAYDEYDMHRDYDVMIWGYIDMWLAYYVMPWHGLDVDMLML